MAGKGRPTTAGFTRGLGRMDASVIFMNDEGTENGGLIFGGRRHRNGKVSSYRHLSFDNYDQDQTLVLQASQNDTTRKTSYVGINDRPAWDEGPLLKLLYGSPSLSAAQREAALKAFEKKAPRRRATRLSRHPQGSLVGPGAGRSSGTPAHHHQGQGRRRSRTAVPRCTRQGG